MFFNSPEINLHEEVLRQTAEDGLLKFGINYLDDATEGILKSDIILLGARSGAGKTQLCTNIAWSNVLKGKRVHYIALEAEKYEIERRIKYRIFCEYFLKIKPKTKHRLSYKNWALGRFLKDCEEIEKLASSEFEFKAQSLFTYYKEEAFDLSKFIDTVLYCADSTDLIIVDHVHYFDFDDGKNENSSIKEIVTVARDLALRNNIPIILVAHIRKADRFSSSPVPELEDFHGSSDLYKVATKAITLAAGIKYTPDGVAETLMKVVKDRFDSSLTRHLGLLHFDVKRGSYAEKYQVGPEAQKRGEEFNEYVLADYPAWARPQTRAGGETPNVLRNHATEAILRRAKEAPADSINNKRPYKDD